MQAKQTPLEATFNIAGGSTKLSTTNSMMLDDMEQEFEQADDPLVPIPYANDEEDIDISAKIETIFEAAIDAYTNQTELTEIVEPKYAARNAEVAAQYLQLALNTAALKAKIKNDKRKTQQFSAPATTINNSNVVVASRNEILKLMAEKNKKE